MIGGPFITVCRRQKCTTGSSSHAEIVAASDISSDVMWSRGQSEAFGVRQELASVMYIDNKSTLDIIFDYSADAKLRSTRLFYDSGEVLCQVQTRLMCVSCDVYSNTRVYITCSACVSPAGT